MKQPDIPRSGKRGQFVWQGGPHGQFCHALVPPGNPRTSAQVAARRLFAEIKARWPKLTDDQRALWHAFGSSENSTPRLRQSGPLGGSLLFQRINYTLAFYGRPQVDRPPPRPSFAPLAVKALLITNVAKVIKVLLVCPSDPGDGTMLHASLPRRSRCRGCTDFRFIGACPAPSEGLADITTMYTNRVGSLRPGEKLFLRVIQMIDGLGKPTRSFQRYCAGSSLTRPSSSVAPELSREKGSREPGTGPAARSRRKVHGSEDVKRNC